MSAWADTQPSLRRALGVRDATVVGLSAMIGAGVFVAFVPAAQAAGSGLVLALAIAATVAACNALSTAQLAVAHPVSGGVYVYGGRVLGPWWGYLAGWGFVVGKTASCAAVALAFAAYVAPDGLELVVALTAVVGMGALAMAGVQRTARAAVVLVTLAVVAIAALVVAALAAGTASGGGIDVAGMLDEGISGILQASGLLFFAFAGYARIATLGEEVHDPSRTLPRAIGVSLALVVGLYLVVGVTLLATLGTDQLAAADAPLEAAALRLGHPWLALVAVVAGAAATLGALLALLLGVSRTTFAMARDRELPRALAAVDARHGVPRRAQAAVGLAVVLIVIVFNITAAIGLSSLAVLTYYLVANIAALRQPADQRLAHPAISALGATGCVTLMLTLPRESVLVGAGVLLAGLAVRTIRLRLGSGPSRAAG